MICTPATLSPFAANRAMLAPSSVDFAAREEVIAKLEADYDESLLQIDELNARLESCLAFLTGKPATPPAAADVSAPQAQPLREAA